MRNLKKVLSLVLVVAMLASMMIVGAAAAEPEKTNYPEAAAVITGIKVMEGDDNGMRYGDTVTREEAAAIICRILLGSTAETLKTTTAPFEDVAASRWSAGYIAYLKAQGIVSGVSDTEFDPTAKVTGIAFAKMLLTAVGYGKVGEFEGAAWDINTITLANEKGIYATTKAADLAAGATREECMLYAFNTITKVPTVKYNKTFESYYTGESAMSPATGALLLNYTLGKTKFNLVSETANVTDTFGRPAVTYKLGNDVLAANVVNAEPLFTVANRVTGATLYAKLGAAAVAKITTVDQWIDGVKSSAGTLTNAILVAVDPATPTVVANQGAVTEAYLSADGKTLTLVTYYEYIGQVTAIDAKTGVVTLTDSTTPGGTVTGKIAGVALFDYVIYTKDADATTPAYKVVTAEKAAPVTGTYQKTNAIGQYVIDGVAYVDSYVKNAGASDPLSYGVAFYVYTDSLGNILLVKAVDTTVKSSDYLYLKDAVITPASSGIQGTPLTAKMEVVYATGGKAIVNYTVGTNALGQATIVLPDTTVPVVIDNTTDGLLATDKWYSYVTAEDGSVTLVAAATNLSNTLGVDTGKFAVTGTTAKATSKTVLRVVNANGVVETYTGIANFPASVSESYKTMFDIDTTTNSIIAINAYGTAASIAPAPLDKVGYCSKYLYQDNLGYHYTFVIDGAEVEVVDNEAGLANKAYKVTTVAGKYIIKENTAADAVVATDDAVYSLADAKYTTNIIIAVDDQYFTIADADMSNVTSYYVNASLKPTYVYDLANGGAAGTLTAGRAATIAYYTSDNTCAQYVWLH